jgi:hypothetical protein
METSRAHEELEWQVMIDPEAALDALIERYARRAPAQVDTTASRATT